MTDPYFDWLDEQDRIDTPIEKADLALAHRDRLRDHAPLLVSDARAAVTAGRLSPERKERS
jgi:hypothetical protein